MADRLRQAVHRAEEAATGIGKIGKMKINKKRGQITVYIIVGLLILIALVLGAYFLVSSAQPGTGPNQVTKVPVELEPVNKFVTDCLKATTEDAIKTVMEHGGYADFTKLTANKFQPTEANSVEYSPDSDYLVPYWSYLKSKDTCTAGCEFASMAKPLCRQGSSGNACITQGKNSVEEEIDWYITQNLGKCLNGFITFKQQQMIVEQVGDIKPTTTIRNGSVSVLLELPLRITYQGTVKNIKDFTTVVDSSIAELYTVAVDIANYEANNCFVERHQVNVMAYYQGWKSNDLPPFSADTFGDHASKFWFKQNVEKRLISVTSFAMQNINIFNTSEFDYVKVQESGSYKDTVQAMYNQFIFFPLSAYHDVKVNLFYFPWWNPYFDIAPSKGSLIGPSELFEGSGSGWLSMILNTVAPKTYEYSYHYSFPAMVEIRKWDEKSLREELMRFALEPNIRANKCFSPQSTIITETSAESMICDPEFRGTAKQTIRVSDELTNAPVMGAEVFFYAGDSCSLGLTDSSGKLVTTFPSAAGGLIDIKKDGYLEYFVSEQDFSTLGDIKIKPLFSKAIEISIFNETNMVKMTSMNEAVWKSFRSSVTSAPDKTQSLIVTLSREKESYHDGSLEQTVSIVPDENGVVQVTPSSIQLAPGNYSVEIMLISNQSLTVVKEYDRLCVNCKKKPKDECKSSPNWLPECNDCDWAETSSCTKKCWEQTDCYKWGFTCGSGCDAEEDTSLPEATLASVPAGGVVFDATNSYWKIGDYTALKEPLNKAVKFYVVQQNPPYRHYRLENLDAYRTYSKSNKYLFEPEFTNG